MRDAHLGTGPDPAEAHEHAPRVIVHRVDEDPAVGYRYNYLIYAFDHPRGEVEAWAYLHDGERLVTVTRAPALAPDEVWRDVFAGILDYLGRRFEEVHLENPDGISHTVLKRSEAV